MKESLLLRQTKMLTILERVSSIYASDFPLISFEK